MENQNLDFLTAFPQTEYGGRWEAAFLMVKADAYEKGGGHQTLKFEVADDMKLGLLFRAQGFHCTAVNGIKRIQLRWQNGFAACLKGLLKNGYAAHEFSLLNILFSTIFFFSLLRGTLVLLFFITVEFLPRAPVCSESSDSSFYSPHGKPPVGDAWLDGFFVDAFYISRSGCDIYSLYNRDYLSRRHSVA